MASQKRANEVEGDQTSKKQKLPVNYVPGTQVVVLEYEDVAKGELSDLSESIEKAFGYDGLGLLVVRGVPKFVEYRKRLLPLAHKFANLPEDTKNKTAHPESFYSFGWSHGKEIFDGQPDLAKGSYYANPQYDQPFTDEAIIKKYPAFAHPNIWPKDMPELRTAFMELGTLICQVGELIGLQCDMFTHKTRPQARSLSNVIKNSRTAKARLLHYFPLKEGSTQSTQFGDNYSSWCGWHNDHGSLTGLCSAMYLDREGNEVTVPDKEAGLYCKSRTGQLTKVPIPADCLAFQIGETAQIHSGGLMQATPHCVRGAQGKAAEGISRETFAVFMEPQWAESMALPNGAKEDDVLRGSGSRDLPPGVPPLGARWKQEMDFGEFTEKTLKSYYK